MLLVLGALSAFGPISTDVYLPGLPALARDLHASSSAAQLTLSACMLGLAGGQLIAGIVSDVRGRRRPLALGLVLFLLSSLGCAAAPGVVPLLVLRLVEGFAGGAGIAIARAIVRDRASGHDAAHAYGVLMVIAGLGPILAPSLGAGLLRVTDWRGIFVALALIGAFLMVSAVTLVPETLQLNERRSGGLHSTASAFATLLRDRRYVTHALSCSLAGAVAVAYIAGSPFVLEHSHHLSAQQFSLVFAGVGAAGLVARQLAVGWTRRAGPADVLRGSITCQFVGATGVLAFTLFDPALLPLLACLTVAVASMGAILPAAVALCMEDHPDLAGSASGLLGFTQAILSSAVAPLVGIGGAGATAPMGIAMVSCASAAIVSVTLSRRYGAGAVRTLPLAPLDYSQPARPAN